MSTDPIKNLEDDGLIIRKRFKYYGVPRSFIAITETLQNKLQLISKEPDLLPLLGFLKVKLKIVAQKDQQ